MKRKLLLANLAILVIGFCMFAVPQVLNARIADIQCVCPLPDWFDPANGDSVIVNQCDGSTPGVGVCTDKLCAVACGNCGTVHLYFCIRALVSPTE